MCNSIIIQISATMKKKKKIEFGIHDKFKTAKTSGV